MKTRKENYTASGTKMGQGFKVHAHSRNGVYIYYISRRDGKCCIHRSENNILEAESEYESLSQPTRRGKQTPFHRACSRSLRPR